MLRCCSRKQTQALPFPSSLATLVRHHPHTVEAYVSAPLQHPTSLEGPLDPSFGFVLTGHYPISIARLNLTMPSSNDLDCRTLNELMKAEDTHLRAALSVVADVSRKMDDACQDLKVSLWERRKELDARLYEPEYSDVESLADLMDPPYAYSGVERKFR